MGENAGHKQEDKLGQPYDLKLIRRLAPFIKPYQRFLWASIALIVVITFFDLALPYITKVAIDRYIVPQRMVDHAVSAAQGDPEAAKTGRRYLLADTAQATVKRVVKRYPHLFKIEGDAARIAFSDLAALTARDREVLLKKDIIGVRWLAILFFSVIIINYMLNFTQIYLMELTGQRAMHDLRMTLFAHVQTLSVPFFSRNPVGRLVTRVTNDIQNMHEFFTSVIVFVFKDMFLLIGIAAVLLSINWKLALVAFAVLPFVLWASLYFSTLARDVFRVLRVKLAEINTLFLETLGGLRVIQLFLREKANYRKFARINHDNYLAGMRQIRIFAVFMPVIEFLSAITVAAVIYYGGSGVIAQNISLGALAAFIAYMRMFFRPIRDIAEKYNILQNALSSAERIFLLLDSTEIEPALQRSVSAADMPADEILEIEMDRVGFAYVPGEPVLHDISFTVKAGRTVALVGPTGSGKTSLVNLIIRFYDPDTGRILLNGRDVKTMDPRYIRSKTALVMQDPFLFSETIFDNIFQGAGHVSQAKIQRIVNASNLDSLVARLPDGLDTVLGEGGASLSSGQRQLISIARAFARDPQLIIMDEATSYVDTEAEQQIQAALFNLMQNRTALVIAHRLTTARSADQIIVLNRGRIVESGTHGELMDKEGFYFRLNQLRD